MRDPVEPPRAFGTRILLAVLAAGAGCGAAPTDEPASQPIDPTNGPVAPIQQPIFGGNTAGTCQWPSTVLLNGCTGTLIHPLIVTTASHCGTNHRTAIFGENNRTGAQRRIPIEYCRTFQRGGPVGTDYAFCKLRTPVTDVPIVPPLMGCELDVLQPGQKVVVAGFGVNTDDDMGFGTKRWVETTFMGVDATGRARVGGMGKAPCFGDSGGPAFVQLRDGSWRAFGIDSAGTAQSCTAGDVMATIYKAVPWIEEQTGIDVTPCHDADGTWHPGPECQGFSVDPLGPGRTWANGCAEPRTTPPLATCGAAYNGPPPTDAGAVATDARPTPPPMPAPDAAVDTPPAPGLITGMTIDLPATTPARADAAPPRTVVRDAASVVPAPLGNNPLGCECNFGRSHGGETPWLLLIGFAPFLRRRRR